MSDDPMEEAAKWLRFLGMQEAKSVIDDALTVENDAQAEKDRRRVYELTDGDHSTRDIAAAVGVPDSTVSRWQRKWSKIGILRKEGDYSPYEHIIPLEAVGLDCPDNLKPDEDTDG